MEKVKIGIITMSASDNCGSLLQAYALQHVLTNKFKCDVEIIDFCSNKSSEVYDIFPRNFYMHPKKTLFNLKHLKSIKSQKLDYENFRNRFLNMSSNKYRTVEDLKCLYDTYDIIITGSDQVWNINMTDYDDAFFIPWATKSRKIAYAASLGSTNLIEGTKKEQITGWLDDFERISVREETGKQTLNQLTDNDISVLADPTLLLSYDDWAFIAGKPLVKGNYIFFYSWSYPNEEMNELVQKFAKQHNLDVYVINSSKWYKHRPEKFQFKLCKQAGPDAFVNLMMNAEYVFVQSFHGAVFGNLLHKRFFFLNERKDNTVDFRAANILGLLQEEKQIVHSSKDIEEAMNSTLTYTSNEYELLKNRSLLYLEQVVNIK